MSERQITPGEDLYHLLKEFNTLIEKGPEYNHEANNVKVRIQKGMAFLMAKDRDVYNNCIESLADIRIVAEDIIYTRTIKISEKILNKLGLDGKTFDDQYKNKMVKEIGQLIAKKVKNISMTTTKTHEEITKIYEVTFEK